MKTEAELGRVQPPGAGREAWKRLCSGLQKEPALPDTLIQASGLLNLGENTFLSLSAFQFLIAPTANQYSAAGYFKIYTLQKLEAGIRLAGTCSNIKYVCMSDIHTSYF